MAALWSKFGPFVQNGLILTSGPNFELLILMSSFQRNFMDYVLQEQRYAHLKFVWRIAPILKENNSVLNR